MASSIPNSEVFSSWGPPVLLQVLYLLNPGLSNSSTRRNFFAYLSNLEFLPQFLVWKDCFALSYAISERGSRLKLL